MGSRIEDNGQRTQIMGKVLILLLGCLFLSGVLAETKKNAGNNKQMSLAELMNEFKNSYSANRGKRNIEEEDYQTFDETELSEEEIDELLGYYNHEDYFLDSNPIRGKRNPNSMILMPTGNRDFNLPRPNGLLTMGKRNPNNLLLPLFQKRGGDNNAKRETNLDEFFTSRGKKSFVLMPKPSARGYSAKATFSAARG